MPPAPITLIARVMIRTTAGLKNKVQDLIEAKEIEFDAPEKPNVIIAPVPKHDSGVNVIEDDEKESDIDSGFT